MSRIFFKGTKFQVEGIEVLSSDGRVVPYEVVVHPGAVVVLALHNENEILLIKNERYAIGKTLLELPAGTLEENEEPISCAKRELEEETGYLAAHLEPLFSFYTTPGFCTERLFIFVAKNLEKREQKLDTTERIEVVSMTFDQALEKIKTKEIVDGKTIAALLYYHTYLKASA